MWPNYNINYGNNSLGLGDLSFAPTMGDRYSNPIIPTAPARVSTSGYTPSASSAYSPSASSLGSSWTPTGISNQGAGSLAPPVANNAVQPGLGGTGQGDKPGMFGGIWDKIGGLEGAMGLLQGIGSIWAANKQLGMMKESLNLNRRAFETNLANQTKSYNTALEDRANARASFTGQSRAETDDYINRHRL